MWWVVAGLSSGFSIAGSHASRRAIQADEQARRNALYLQAEDLQRQRELEQKQTEIREKQRKETLEQTLALQNVFAAASGFKSNAVSFAAIKSNDINRYLKANEIDQMFSNERQESLTRNINALIKGVSLSRESESRRIGANAIQGGANLLNIGINAYSIFSDENSDSKSKSKAKVKVK